ncbi:MAG: MerR HTH family regulatory protein [Saliniramus fredricksonii]|uniref:MerR HTH family regulatory protein n=1 Tax=Saliniramus fredricksonii TaxID=1653334 RepID=A0A0P7Y4H1_9HYPH|nr:MerR family transcriptional regulator [Saliniramus fredricksonii]KPQ11512.1 MAG: MerR HTH family regulatory protein [Saliniramus fredricksonii]SCC82419.1 MerR HTH family regulatory protein [Saliniramus fredricksonii]
MEKSPDAFRTISEVAEDLDLPQHVLRFWETRFTQIKPLKRAGGRRYYRPSDIDLLQGIRRLLYAEGYTIKGVQRILKSEGVRAVEAIGRGEVTLEARPADAPEAAEPDVDAQARARRGDNAAATDTGFDDDATDAAIPIEMGTRATGRRAALDRGQLRAALDELRECRRVLDNLMLPGDSES